MFFSYGNDFTLFDQWAVVVLPFRVKMETRLWQLLEETYSSTVKLTILLFEQLQDACDSSSIAEFLE